MGKLSQFNCDLYNGKSSGSGISLALLSCLHRDMGPIWHPDARLHTQEETAYGKHICPLLPGPTPCLGHAHGLLASASFPGRDLVAGSRSITSCTGPSDTPGGAPL